LRPLPVAHRPLSEESQVRLRYVDLIVRSEARRMVELRATVLRSCVLRWILGGTSKLKLQCFRWCTAALRRAHSGPT
jgi:hypothetical protein